MSLSIGEQLRLVSGPLQVIRPRVLRLAEAGEALAGRIAQVGRCGCQTNWCRGCMADAANDAALAQWKEVKK